MSKSTFTNEKIKEMIRFCSIGYDAWSKVVNKDTTNNFIAGRDRSPVGQIYWDSFNNEISCILAVHTFLENYLSPQLPKNSFSQANQKRSSFRNLAVNYKTQCSTKHLVNEIDKKIDKNDALEEDRLKDLTVSAASLGSTVNDVSSHINGILTTFGAFKSMKNNLASLNAPWEESYKTIRRDFFSIASNIAGIFAPTPVGQSIIVYWMSRDFADYIKLNKASQKLSENKQKLLNAADTFSGDTAIGEFYTYVLVTALAEHYGFSPNNGLKINPKHKYLNAPKPF